MNEPIFEIKEESNYSSVYESIQFKSVLPVRSLMEKIFKQQHKQLFLNIERKEANL